MGYVLHWLPVSQHHEAWISVWVCQSGIANAYFQELCFPTTGFDACINLRSGSGGKAVVALACN